MGNYQQYQSFILVWDFVFTQASTAFSKKNHGSFSSVDDGSLQNHLKEIGKEINEQLYEKKIIPQSSIK